MEGKMKREGEGGREEKVVSWIDRIWFFDLIKLPKG